MLLLTKSHHVDGELDKVEHRERARTLSTVCKDKFCSCKFNTFISKKPSQFPKNSSFNFSNMQDNGAQSPWTRISRFLPNTRTIMQFSEGRAPLPTDRIIYVCGSFDLFHIGHLCFLEEAQKLGDYLIVGIYNDQVNLL